eukprot:TRINITY_DN132_c0_g1_i4.p1 TRINITY_DN132_c0_g1~~TRINITY_DN132_c0_g1_i4.p1  ORF type:complete len:1534 (+),score=461.83 TRINITY_DN132_c0_g1_i4:73-4674(+)
MSAAAGDLQPPAAPDGADGPPMLRVVCASDVLTGDYVRESAVRWNGENGMSVIVAAPGSGGRPHWQFEVFDDVQVSSVEAAAFPHLVECWTYRDGKACAVSFTLPGMPPAPVAVAGYVPPRPVEQAASVPAVQAAAPAPTPTPAPVPVRTAPPPPVERAAPVPVVQVPAPAVRAPVPAVQAPVPAVQAPGPAPVPARSRIPARSPPPPPAEQPLPAERPPAYCPPPPPTEQAVQAPRAPAPAASAPPPPARPEQASAPAAVVPAADAAAAVQPAPAAAAPAPAGRPPTPGARVVDGKWCVQGRCLGVGTYGKVYAGYDIETGASVAVKTSAPQAGLTPRQVANQIQLLRREICVQRECDNHPNLLPILGFIEGDGRWTIVTPLMDGGDLSLLLVYQKPLDPVPLRQLCGDLLCGLGELQRRNIVHRDFKPANLLLSSSDPLRAVLKIADYGFARALQEPDDLLCTKCGTGGYMAPEVIDLEQRTYSANADTFSVGVVIWEMASGQRPFPDGDASGAMRGSMLRGRTRNDKLLPPACLKCCKQLMEPRHRYRPTVAQLEQTGDAWLLECMEARRKRDAGVDEGASPSQSEEHIGGADGAGWVVLRGRPLLEGTLGAVFEGRSSGTQERVAVKELKKDRLTPSQREMLDLEVGLAGRREEHANLLTVVAALEEPGRYLIVTPFMDGGDLAQELRGGPLVGVALRQQCGDLLCGLGELQRRKVVHRDIKPQNLLLTSRDRLRAVLKIGDFASAKAMGDADDLMMTKCGSPSYAAPEVFDVQQRMYSASADTFSAGVVMAEMGTGGLPFVGTEIGVLRRQMMRQQLRRSELLPPACLVCCKLMLAYNPSERPSVAQLRTDGDAWLLECVAACEERDTGVRRAPSAQAAAADPGTGAGDVGALTRGSGPSVNLAAHGLALQSASEVLCFSHDAARGRFLVGMRGGFNVTAVGGDGGAGSVSEQDQFRALGGGVGAIVAVGASVAGVPAKDGLLLAIAGGGRPAALPIGTVALWDENAGAGRPVDRIDVGEPVVSLAAERTWLAVVCPEHIFVYHLDPHVGVVPKHKLRTASNPRGVVALRFRPRGDGVLCFPDGSGPGRLRMAALSASDVAAAKPCPAEDFPLTAWLQHATASVQRRNAKVETVLKMRRSEYDCPFSASPPATHVADCECEEPIAAVAVDALCDEIAVVTRSGRLVYLFSRQGGRPRAQLSRGAYDAVVMSLSFAEHQGRLFLCTSSQRTAHVWKSVGAHEQEFQYWTGRVHNMPDAAVFAGFCSAVPGSNLWLYGPEQGRLQMRLFDTSLQRSDVPLVGRTRTVPAPCSMLRKDEIMDRCPLPHCILLGDRRQRRSENVFVHVIAEVNSAARLVDQREDKPAVAVVVREDELVLVPNDPRRNVVVVDHSWVADVQPGSGYGSHPYAVDVKLRFAGTVSIQFPGQSDRDTFKRTLLREGARSRGRPELSPIRRLWLFLLWQRQLDRVRSEPTWLPSQHDGELRGALGPCSVLHHVQLFIAGPRPCPLPWGGPAAEWFLSRVIGALRPW